MKYRQMIDNQGTITNRVVVNAKLVRKGVCPCGYSTMADHVPIGKVYQVVVDSWGTMTVTCGGCGRANVVESIMVEDGNSQVYKHLPRLLFELEKQDVN